MKIIIAGDGKMGATLTRQLSAEGNDLTLIDSNPKVLESSEERYDVMVVQGNCASMEVLLQAGVKEADLLIAVAGADEINLLCCMTAHGLNERIHTIARVRNPEYTDQIYEMSGMFALSMAVNPEKQAAAEIARLLRYPGFLKRDTFAKGRVEIVELRIDEHSKLCNVALNDMNGIVKCKILVCAVLRNGRAITPDGNFVLREGDRIFVTASADTLTILLKNLGIITHKVKRVILCGGGRVSYYLAKQLQSGGINVQIIERDLDRCNHLAAILRGWPSERGGKTNVRYVRAMKNQTGAARPVHTIADGQAEAMEFSVDESTMHCGEPLKNLRLKKGVLVVCITKGAKQEIPNGDSYFNHGDTLIIVTNGEKGIYQLNDIFE